MKRAVLLAALACIAYGELPAPEQTAIDKISAGSLRTNLSYIASDELEGRDTPSRGLDLAADYIADQFRRAGLEPAANGSWFQFAKFDQATVSMEGFYLALASSGREINLTREQVRVTSLDGLELSHSPVVRLPGNGIIPAIAGQIVAGDERSYGNEISLNELQARKPALILIVGRSRRARRSAEHPILEEADGNHAPLVYIRSSEAVTLLGAAGDLRVSLHLAKPVLNEVLLRNVVGILRGSDAGLRDQYLLLTAHYDHLGKNSRGIYNGANDDGSGTVTVIEIARALATLNPHPKRSILFMTLFGEEEGLLGSYYYTHHPLVPLRETIADVNLEQVGRTDDQSEEGAPITPRIREFGFSGPSYSNLPEIMGDAARSEGVDVFKRKDADDYFDRSDNYSFAQYGVVAHTIAVAFEFPDYHQPGDKLQKIDFANMATVDRGIAAGILRLANEREAPKWSNAKGAAPYRDGGR